jgi:hypothetical protein
MSHQFIGPNLIQVTSPDGLKGILIDATTNSIIKDWGGNLTIINPDDVKVWYVKENHLSAQKLEPLSFNSYGSGCYWYYFGGVWYRICN